METCETRRAFKVCLLLADANRWAPRGEMRGEKKDVTGNMAKRRKAQNFGVKKKHQFLQNFKQE